METAPKVFDYYRFINKKTGSDTNYCADFAFFTLSIIASKYNAVAKVDAADAWELDKELSGPRFEKTSLWGKNADQARQLLSSAPAGTIITVRSHSAFAQTLEEGLPSHAMISLGGGKYAQNIGNRLVMMDVKTATFATDKKTGQVAVGGFDIVSSSAMYAPDFQSFHSSKELAISPSDLGLDGKVTPGGFAKKIHEKYGLPQTYIIGMILSQNGLSASQMEYYKQGMSVKIGLPADRVQKYAPQFNVTPALAAYVPPINVNKASLGFFASSGKDSHLDALKTRMKDFKAQITRLGKIRERLGIGENAFNNLMAVLYNEKYSSTKEFETRKTAENAYVSLMGVNSWVKEVKTIGDFQISIDYVNGIISGKEGMTGLRKAMGMAGVADKDLESKLGNWKSLGKADRRKIIAKQILSNEALSLYFAYQMYKSNFEALQGNSEKHMGMNHPIGGLEASAFFAHNRGMPRTAVAIFQQNLIIAAEEAGIAPGKLKIDGKLGNETLALLKKVCKHYKLLEVNYQRGNGHYALAIADLDEKNPGEVALFEKIISKYSGTAMFFKDYLKIGSARTVLDPAFLKSHPANLTQYLSNYLVFFSTEKVKTVF